MRLRNFLAILFATIALVACNTGGGEKKGTAGNDGQPKENKDSVMVVKDYHGNGNLWHRKEVMNLNYPKTGKEAKWVLHGTVTEYYENKKNVLATKATYVRGKKEGKTYKYYTDGKVYFERDYVNNRKDGFVKKYHQSGYLISKTPYKSDMLGLGAQEYNSKGEELTMPVLKVWTKDTRRENGTYTVYAKVVDKYGNNVKAEFMSGMLIEADGNKYAHPNLQKITKIGKDRVAQISFYESTGFPPFVSVVAKHISPKGTPVLLNKVITIR